MTIKAALTLALSVFSIVSYGQLDKDIFPLNREFKRGGLYIAPHATFTLGDKNEDTYRHLDSTYDFSIDGKGKFGYGLEVGWFHSFKNARLIHYLEAGVAYRVFKGKAEHSGELTTLSGQQAFESENEF
ncbi:MAG: hypothetical protein WD530_07530, partial [Vicingaceae bacterium]